MSFIARIAGFDGLDSFEGTLFQEVTVLTGYRIAYLSAMSTLGLKDF